MWLFALLHLCVLMANDSVSSHRQAVRSIEAIVGCHLLYVLCVASLVCRARLSASVLCGSRDRRTIGSVVELMMPAQMTTAVLIAAAVESRVSTDITAMPMNDTTKTTMTMTMTTERGLRHSWLHCCRGYRHYRC